MCPYVVEHQGDWDLFGPKIALGYNTQVHGTTGMTLFTVVLSFQPLRRATLATLTALPIDAIAETPLKGLRLILLFRIAEMCDIADNRTAPSQQRYKLIHDAWLQGKTRFRVRLLVYAGCLPLSTSIADQMALEAQSKLLSRALGRSHHFGHNARHYYRRRKNYEHSLVRPGIPSTHS